MSLITDSLVPHADVNVDCGGGVKLTTKFCSKFCLDPIAGKSSGFVVDEMKKYKRMKVTECGRTAQEIFTTTIACRCVLENQTRW